MTDLPIFYPPKDTLRVLVSWKCNFRCSYCCNDTLPTVRAGIKPIQMEDLDLEPYRVVCISGGEPLLFLDRVKEVCERARGKFIVLYTNGTKMTPGVAARLAEWGVHAINVGLHYPRTFDLLIARVKNSVGRLPMSIRFHVEDTHTELAMRHPGVAFKFWHRDDCDRDNEDRVVLTAIAQVETEPTQPAPSGTPAPETPAAEDSPSQP